MFIHVETAGLSVLWCSRFAVKVHGEILMRVKIVAWSEVAPFKMSQNHVLVIVHSAVLLKVRLTMVGSWLLKG